MKKLIIVVGITTCLSIGCKSKDQKEPGAEKVNKRNLSITAKNAYNDLFLDSMAVEQFITRQKLNDTIANRLRNFYDERNYEFAWFASDGLAQHAMAFRNLYKYADDSTAENKALEERLDEYAANDSLQINAKQPGTIKTELQLTVRFIRSSAIIFKDIDISPEEINGVVPVKKYSLETWLKNTLDNDNSLEKKLESNNESYKLLKEQLRRYAEINSKGGWQALPETANKIKKGKSSSTITLIKKRLHISGEFPSADTSEVFNDDLENAIKQFQLSHGYKPDGLISKQIITEMNVPAVKRVQQILVNMQRMKWMPSTIKGVTIFVNIPEFMLYVRDGKNKLFDMPVVVGKEGNNTTMFYGDLNEIVFSPYWNIPKSIVQKEVLPQMEKDPDYLSKKHMEIKGESNGVPVIRQIPGEDNPLGKVKFLFPNSFNIYFHDTPEKELFNKEKRAFSHGCIRIADPVKLANFLLQDDKAWTPEKIDSAMNSGQEKYVRIKRNVPVLITYYTAWVDENGLLNFREDTYGHDEKMAAKMFTDSL